MQDANHTVNQYKPALSMPEEENYINESFDKLLSSLVIANRSWSEHGTAIGRKCDHDSNLVGYGSANPLLNTKRMLGRVSRWIYPRIFC